MKIRSGFVSNSSSSSYVCVVQKDAYESIKDSLTPIELAVIESVFRETDVFGHKCIVGEWWSGNMSTIEYIEHEVVERAKEIAKEKGVELENSDYWSDEIYDALNRWFGNLPKEKYFFHSVSDG